ncbi:hypothetical protein C8R44DRAFT_921465 [Mycena epipterygia]|nr:hypothetical protein C8R44DRAFT_921465 [Mycena epipterygia]
MPIKLLSPNSCSDPEEIHQYNKNFRLGPERIQETNIPCQFPPRLFFPEAAVRARITRPGRVVVPRISVLSSPLSALCGSLAAVEDSDTSSTDSDRSDIVVTASSNSVRAVVVDSPLQFGSIAPEDVPFTFTSPSPLSTPPSSPDHATSVPAVPPSSPELNASTEDPTIKLLYRLLLGPGLILRMPTWDDIVCEKVYEHDVWCIRQTFLQHIFDSLDKLVVAVHCAGNDHNPYRDGPVPRSLPSKALKELRTTIPGISLFRNYVARDVDEIAFASPAAAKDYISLAQEVYVHFLHWTANCFRSSLEHGYTSEWNLGAAIGMSRTEVLRRITPNITYGSHSSLKRLMSHDIHANEMDFACANLISLHAQRLLISEREDDVYLTIWPLPERSYYAFNEEPGDEFMRTYLEEMGLTLEDLDTAVMSKEQTNVAWNDIY